MVTEESTVSLEFGQGLDTKTDPKVSAKPVLIQDGIFTNPHRISKRNGYDSMSLSILGGGTILSPTMVKSYKNEILASGLNSTGTPSGGRLFSWSSSLSKWLDKGKYNSVSVSKTIVAAPDSGWINTSDPAQILGTTNTSSALIGNILAVAFDSDVPNQASPSVSSVYFSIIDYATGTKIAPQTQINSAYGGYPSTNYTWGYSKIVALGSSQFAIFYISDTGSVATAARLCYKTVSVSGSGVTVGSEVVLSHCPQSGSTYNYDVASTPGGCVVAVVSATNAIDLYTINTSGTQTHNFTITSGTVGITPVNITLDSTSTNAWIYWASGGDTTRYAIYNASTLANVLTETVITTGLSAIRQIAGLPISATQQYLFYSQLKQPANTATLTVGVYYPIINQDLVDSSGTRISTNSFISGLDIYCKPFFVGSLSYLPCVSYSQTNPVGVVIDTADALPIAKFLPGSAEGVFSAGYNTTSATYVAPSPVAIRHPGFLNTPSLYSSTRVIFSSGFVVSFGQVVPVSSSNLASFPKDVTSSATMGVALVGLDFNHIDAYQGVIQQDTLVLNGGLVCQYDGASVTELGFTLDPDGVSTKGVASGGSLVTGAYIYNIVHQWTDALGNLHQSAPSAPVLVKFTSGTTNSVIIGWNPLNVTQKVSVTTNIFRTVANGTISYLVASLSNSLYGWNNANAFWTDTVADSTITDNPELYTAGGAIVENIAPPASMILWTNNNRAWCVDSENPEILIEYSKTASKGSGVSFSSGILEYVIDSRGGAITGASPMDEKTIIIKKSVPGYFIGDGANDAGGGSTLTPWQPIPSDTGCSNSKSVIAYPNGILFRASNNKGVYQISRGAQVSYFGSPVEAYNSQDIQSAFIVPSKNQIRFLTSNGSSLLYDYVMGQWSAFTNHAGLSSDQFNGLYVYVRSSNNSQDNGSVFIENTSTYLDNATAFAPLVKIQWVKSSSIQNFQRAKRIEMLGDYINGSSAGHGVQISVAYDFGTTFSTPIAYSFGASSSSGAFQYREGLPRQKCNAFQLLIQEITTGQSGEFIDFTDLGLEIGTKKGLNKLPATKSV